MNRKLLHNYFITQSGKVAKVIFVVAFHFCLSILFFTSSLISQNSDSTIKALEQRVQILEQKIFHLEFEIESKKNDTVKVQSVVKEESVVQDGKKEVFIQCAAKTGKGTRCSRRAKPDSKFCGSHQYVGEGKKKK